MTDVVLINIVIILYYIIFYITFFYSLYFVITGFIGIVKKSNFLVFLYCAYGGIGEVVNTVDCGSIMRGFDSHISPHLGKSN